MSEVIDYYAETNTNLGNVLDELPYLTYFGQSFMGNGCKVTEAQLYLVKVAGATGTLRVKIYEHDGVYGTSSVGVGNPICTSDSVDVGVSVQTAYSLISFPFTGGDQKVLHNGVPYLLLATVTGNVGNIFVGVDNSSPTHGGNEVLLFQTSWYPNTNDMCFYVYGEPVTTAHILGLSGVGT